MLWRDGAAFGSGDYALGGGMRLGANRQNLYPSVDLRTLRKSDPVARAFLFWSRMPVVERDGAMLRLSDQRFANPVGGNRFSLTFAAPNP